MTQQQANTVHEQLAVEMFWNVRLGVAALVPTLGLYYLLLTLDSGFEKHIFWALTSAAILLIANCYFFFGEFWIKDSARRVFMANTLITVSAAVVGTSFLTQIPHVKDAQILLTIYAMAVGILGAAAFVFSCHPYSYLLFSISLVGPMLVWLLLAPLLGQKIQGTLFLVYIGTMAFLSFKDYGRRVQLRTALQTVTNLKNQQDGDYFLTSLLISPLSINAAQASEGVKIEFFSEQKKKFSFKNRAYEIGGDINIAHALTLGGKQCTIILNADAMGKSIQGAGGVLVLGSAFQTIMDRTRARNDLSSLSPERWIKETFIQLQKNFESFQGSMLVSVFLGVLENQTGALYWVNAEHPQAVVLRNHKASFLPFDKQFRKLGTPDMMSQVSLSTYMLEPGDVLIVGSDGRDDIHLNSSTPYSRTINEDEYLFLRSVEKAQGKLADVRDQIASHGEITDDLTMIRVEFTGSAPEHDSLKLKHSAISAFKGRHFIEALDQAKQYILHQPLDNPLVYLAAAACFRLDQLEAGIELAERLRMREPENAKYLELLIELHLKAKNKAAALKFFGAIEFAHPTHAKIGAWRKRLAS